MRPHPYKGAEKGAGAVNFPQVVASCHRSRHPQESPLPPVPVRRQRQPLHPHQTGCHRGPGPPQRPLEQGLLSTALWIRLNRLPFPGAPGGVAPGRSFSEVLEPLSRLLAMWRRLPGGRRRGGDATSVGDRFTGRPLRCPPGPGLRETEEGRGDCQKGVRCSGGGKPRSPWVGQGVDPQAGPP